EALAVVGEAPAFAVVVHCAQQAKTEAVVDEGNVRLPGELNERAAPRGEAFSKVLAGDRVGLQDAAGIEVVHAQRGAAVEAGALVEMPILEEKPLGVCLRVVRIGVKDAIGIGREGVSGGRDEGEESESAIDGGETHR